MNTEQFILDALHQPAAAVTYYVSRQLATLFPNKAVLETEDEAFNSEGFAQASLCRREAKGAIFSEFATSWVRAPASIYRWPKNGWFEIQWQDQALDVIELTWSDSGCTRMFRWILAENREIAEAFFAAVCAWNTEIRAEILVFEDGYWHKSGELYRDIRDATIDNLVLHGALRQEIWDDVAQFFASRDTYVSYGIPWKRGILFVGPPGNGKTHTIKALINSMGQSCLYVKSFASPYGTENGNVREAFQRARDMAPCILVLEDLDSLVDDNNRSFFLNELDGFAANAGILALATTNHPERLDPAIVNRPSRFDRKYHFDLPAYDERLSYIRFWNNTLQPPLRMADAVLPTVSEQTAGFSFAYLKELFLSSMMTWIANPTGRNLQDLITAQIGALREQMASLNMMPGTQ